MKWIALIVTLVALVQPASSQEASQVYVNADGQIIGPTPPSGPGYLKYQYQPVDCVTLPCPNHFVLAADSPSADGVVVWSDELAPDIMGPKKLVAAMRNLTDGPACWVIRGNLIIAEEGTTLRVDELIGDCN